MPTGTVPRSLRAVTAAELPVKAPRRRGSPHDCSLAACGRPAVYAITVPDRRTPSYACRYHLVSLIDRVVPEDLSVVIDRIQR